MADKERKYFKVNAIQKVLDSLGKNLRIPVKGLLIGGGAMSLNGDKQATKDVDLVVGKQEEFQAILESAKGTNFRNDTVKFQGSDESGTIVLVNDEGFHIDLFLKLVCGRFRIHDGIMKRARYYRRFGHLDINLLSDEDLFLSKSVTERDRDIKDMYKLYMKGIDHHLLIKEMESQNKFTETIWEAFLTMKLTELEDLYQIIIPWKEEIESLAIKKMEGKKQKPDYSIHLQ